MRTTSYRFGEGNWALRIASVLLCLTLASTYLLFGMYARYTTSATGSAAARVAKFEVTMTATADTDTTTLNGLTMDDKTQDKKEYGFSITNKSEVAVAYDIRVTFDNSLPEGVVPTVKLNGKADVTGTPNEKRTEFSFTSGDFVFGPKNETKNHTLTITVNYYNNANNLQAVQLDDTAVTISVTARQVD